MSFSSFPPSSLALLSLPLCAHLSACVYVRPHTFILCAPLVSWEVCIGAGAAVFLNLPATQRGKIWATHSSAHDSCGVHRGIWNTSHFNKLQIKTLLECSFFNFFLNAWYGHQVESLVEHLKQREDDSAQQLGAFYHITHFVNCFFFAAQTFLKETNKQRECPRAFNHQDTYYFTGIINLWKCYFDHFTCMHHC